jgi:prevent-host-death family protein
MKGARVNVAEAKKHFSDLLGRVAYGKETITITRRSKPMAKLVPVGPEGGQPHLADVRGWLDERDEFFRTIDQIVKARRKRVPRVVRRTQR